jgi:hypothetical protein
MDPKRNAAAPLLWHVQAAKTIKNDLADEHFVVNSTSN